MPGGELFTIVAFSHGFASPLTWDDKAVRQRLNFQGGPFDCVVAWMSVVGIGSGEHLTNVNALVEAWQNREATKVAATLEKVVRRRGFHVVRDEEEAPPDGLGESMENETGERE